MNKLFLLFLFPLAMAGLYGQDEVVNYNSQELHEDFQLLKQALTEAHPGLYRYSSKMQMDSAFDAAGQKLTRPMTELDFYRIVNPVVARVKCGHTKLHRREQADNAYAFFDRGLFPLGLYFKDEETYVVRSYSETDLLPQGSRLVAINGIPVLQVRDSLFNNIFADGYVESARYRELNDRFAGYFATFFGPSTNFEVAYIAPDSRQTVTKVLPAVTLEDINRWTPKMDAKENFQLSFPAPGIAVLRIAVFVPADNGPDFEAFLKESFEAIEKNGVEHLIIDLRDNQGGIDAWGKKLLAYLTDEPFTYYDRLNVTTDQPFSFEEQALLPPNIGPLRSFIKQEGSGYVFTFNENLGIQQPVENPYLDKVYVLQNGHSFSVTSEFAAIAKDRKRAVFIGEENGGAMEGNNSGAFAIVTLPHTGLTLAIPLVAYHTKLLHSWETGRGVMADYPVQPTIADVLQNRDTVMEAAMNLCVQ